MGTESQLRAFDTLARVLVFRMYFHFRFIITRAFSANSSQTETTSRSQCVDGTYEHDGRDCCMCAAGLKVVKHCITSPHDGKCDTCDDGTYSSHPNYQTTCEPCTSCLHPHENLEVDSPCTSARDAKCRCQKDHYCASGTDVCRLCDPCKKCGTEGVKVACVGNKNTVCNDKVEGGTYSWLIIIIVAGLLSICAAVVTFCIYKKKCRNKYTPDPKSISNGNDQEMLPINGKKNQTFHDVDPQPFLHDIAQVIGWKVMKEVAMRIGIQHTTIESCHLNNPNDSEEQTLQLLRIWVEKKGSKALNDLIQILQSIGKNSMAEKVIEIVSRDNS